MLPYMKGKSGLFSVKYCKSMLEVTGIFTLSFLYPPPPQNNVGRNSQDYLIFFSSENNQQCIAQGTSAVLLCNDPVMLPQLKTIFPVLIHIGYRPFPSLFIPNFGVVLLWNARLILAKSLLISLWLLFLCQCQIFSTTLLLRHFFLPGNHRYILLRQVHQCYIFSKCYLFQTYTKHCICTPQCSFVILLAAISSDLICRYLQF